MHLVCAVSLDCSVGHFLQFLIHKADNFLSKLLKSLIRVIRWHPDTRPGPGNQTPGKPDTRATRHPVTGYTRLKCTRGKTDNRGKCYVAKIATRVFF